MLPLEAFNKHAMTKDGRQAYCRECGRAYKNGRPGRHRAERYGLSDLDYEAIRAAQDDRCAICRTDQPGGNGAWHVDHDHLTGEVRGLLCLRCNAGLGQLGDNVETMRTAIAYLESPPARKALSRKAA
jgi:hypothetical protein